MITNKQMDDWFEKFSDMLKPILEQAKEVGEIKAVWLEQKVRTNRGNVRRITEGMQISVADGVIMSKGNLTHKILGCFGSIDSGILFVNVINIETMQLSRIDLGETI